MKKIVILALAIFAMQNATAQFAAVVNGKVVREKKPMNNLELLYKAQFLLKNIAPELTFDRVRQTASISAQNFAQLPKSGIYNPIIAVVGIPPKDAAGMYKNYDAVTLKRDFRGIVSSSRNFLTQIDNKFKALSQKYPEIQLHRHAGTREEGLLIASYRNPESEEGNQLDLVQVRIVK